MSRRFSVIFRLLAFGFLLFGCALPQKFSPTITPSAPTVSDANWWRPAPDQPIHWHWQLSDTFVFPRDVLDHVTVYDLDGELTSSETVAQLHGLGENIKVICYVEVGVYETYRSDANRFPRQLIGNPVKGWEDSYWLDIRQTDTLLPILEDRFKRWCSDKGFDAIEPDDSEVWTNNPGFPISKAQNRVFLEHIADMAHSLGLSVGLKNNTAEAAELEPYFDWALNEECWLYEECEQLNDSFINNGKAVFNVEYSQEPDCRLANTWHINSARRDLDLSGPVNPSFQGSPCIPDHQDHW
jgi:hypothetical protein